MGGKERAAALIAQIAELIKPEVANLPDEESRQYFWAYLHKSAAVKMRPAPACEFPAPRVAAVAPRAQNPKSDRPADVQEAISVAEDIVWRAAEIEHPDGMEFAESVTEKARCIAGSVESQNKVSANQMRALRNMLEGVLQWQRNQDWN